MMKLILICILCLILVGCDNGITIPCILGWSNETHFCNEFHHYEKKYIEEEIQEDNITLFKYRDYKSDNYNLTFEEIPIGEIYCEIESTPEFICRWGRDELGEYREHCYSEWIYYDLCYKKTNLRYGDLISKTELIQTVFGDFIKLENLKSKN